MPGTVRDEYRREVAASGLTPTAVTHLTRDALGTIDLANLAPADDEALADLVGPGEGWWRHELEERFAFEFGWREGAFRLELSPLVEHAAITATPDARFDATFDATFDGPVVPEATPNPRTIRFVTPPIHAGPSRWYESAAGVDDPRVARLFEFADVADVLVGPDFVAVGLRRPDQWEHLLDSVLTVVAAEFAAAAPATSPTDAANAAPRDQISDARSPSVVHTGALDRAWRELGALRADQPHDLERLLTAVSSTDAAVRQVAGRLMIGADVDIAEAAWSRLLADPSRRVRRAAVDAMVDADRTALRPLLEQALRDTDAWTRWKALRGLVEIGIEPSRSVVALLTDDADFRVRLETARALGGPRD